MLPDKLGWEDSGTEARKGLFVLCDHITEVGKKVVLSEGVRIQMRFVFRSGSRRKADVL